MREKENETERESRIIIYTVYKKEDVHCTCIHVCVYTILSYHSKSSKVQSQILKSTSLS